MRKAINFVHKNAQKKQEKIKIMVITKVMYKKFCKQMHKKQRGNNE